MSASLVFSVIQLVLLIYDSLTSGGRMIRVSGQNLDVVQDPRMQVTLSPLGPQFKGRKRRKRKSERHTGRDDRLWPLKRERRIVPESLCPIDSVCDMKQVQCLSV